MLEGIDGENNEWLESERTFHSPEYASPSGAAKKSRYKLFGVISFIHAEKSPQLQSASVEGHYVIHLCIPKATSLEILKDQIEAIERCMRDSQLFESWICGLKNKQSSETSGISCEPPPLTVASQVSYKILSREFADVFFVL